jgi:hypothetical protein
MPKKEWSVSNQIMVFYYIVADMDIATQSKDEEALEKSLVYPYPITITLKLTSKHITRPKTHIIKKVF